MNSSQLTSLEEFVASRISKSPTGRIRLRESISERKTMQRALHFASYADDCVTFVRSQRAGKRVMAFPIIRDRLPLDLILPDQPNRHLRTRSSGGVGFLLPTSVILSLEVPALRQVCQSLATSPQRDCPGWTVAFAS